MVYFVFVLVALRMSDTSLCDVTASWHLPLVRMEETCRKTRRSTTLVSMASCEAERTHNYSLDGRYPSYVTGDIPRARRDVRNLSHQTSIINNYTRTPSETQLQGPGFG